MSTHRNLIGAGAMLALALASQANAEHKLAASLPFEVDVKTPAPAPFTKAPAPRRESAPAPTDLAVKSPQPAAPAVDVFAGGVLFDTTDSGLWAATRGWKAQFTTQSTTFVPFLGSDAPRNAPLGLRLVDVTVGGESIDAEAGGVTHTHDRVEIERGAIDEAYVLSARGIEQTFTIDEPVAGDVRVRIAVEGEYTGELQVDGIHFKSDIGSILYGRAFVVDANGVRTPIDTMFDGQTIELVAPAKVLADAAYPVVIDPILQSYGVDVSMDDTIRPDVAYEGTTSQFLHVYERVFSAQDSDVFSYCADDNGVIAGTFGVVDVTDTRWANPSVASKRIGAKFGVVAEVGAVGARSIQMRSFDAATRVYATSTLIASSSTGDKLNPTIGGDPNSAGPTYFLVAWERVFDANDHDIQANLVEANGTPAGSYIFVDNSADSLDTKPAISKSNGAGLSATQVWTIVWERRYAADDRDVYAAQIRWSGTIANATYPIMTSSFDETAPAVSSILDGTAAPREYMVVWESKIDATTRDVGVRTFIGTTIQAQYDMSALSNGWLKDPSVDGDGSQYLVAYARHASGFDYDVVAVPLYSVSGQIGASAFVSSLELTLDPSQMPAVAAKHSAGVDSKRFAIAYERTTTSFGDVRAVIFENPKGGPVATMCPGTNATCPCSNGGTGGAGCASSVNANGGLLTANDGACVSDDTFTLVATGLPANASCLFFQGTNSPNSGNGSTFGDGLRCASGSVIRLGTHTCVGGTSLYPLAAEAHVAVKGNLPTAGAVRFYQAWYRNAAAYCTASTFNLTNGVRATWVP